MGKPQAEQRWESTYVSPVDVVDCVAPLQEQCAQEEEGLMSWKMLWTSRTSLQGLHA